MTRAILFLAALAAHAQTYEIVGTVTEVGGGGIPDVELNFQMIDAANRVVRTDARGGFQLTVEKPGTYFVFNPAKPGYFSSGQPFQPIVLDAGRPRGTIAITLVRAGEVTGRVIDAETREPLAGVEVALLTRQWRWGQMTLVGAGRSPSKTDEEGRFRFSGLRPAEYIASVRSQLSWFEKVSNFSEADVVKIDEDYEATYWPGGDDAASALTAVLTSGGYADVGTMLVRKAPQYRVRVKIEGGCAEGESVNVSVSRRGGESAVSLGAAPCSGELLVRGFDPGAYVISAVSERRTGDLATTVTGVAFFEVVDKNLSVTIPLQRNVVLEGQLIIPDGVAQPRLLPRITSRPLDFAGVSAILWAPDQRHFQLAVSPGTQNLSVSDPEGTYVKEIRYNGIPLRSSTLPINSGAPAHKLEIITDDKWGSLAATVTDGSRGVQGSVMILKEGTRVDDLLALGTFTRATGPDGTMPASRLAPGEYRVIAVSATQAQKIHEAGVLARALSTAQRVTVPPGGTQTIAIRLGDVR